MGKLRGGFVWNQIVSSSDSGELPVKVLMSNNLAQKTSILRAFARALGPSDPYLELAHQVRDYYLLVYIILSRGKSQLVGGLAYGAADAAPFQDEFKN
jgi:hypothetical protein